MALPVLRFAEIRDLHDTCLLPWLTLYETTFPPEERMLIAQLLAMFAPHQKATADKASTTRMVAILNDQDSVVGLLLYDLGVPVSALWYLAIEASQRGQGLGSRAYHHVLGEMASHGGEVLVFEVEIPHGPADDTQHQLAERRITFYRRLGARLLGGIRYMQRVGEHQPPVPLHIMVHAPEGVDATTAFELAKAIFGESLTQVGELTLV